MRSRLCSHARRGPLVHPGCGRRPARSEAYVVLSPYRFLRAERVDAPGAAYRAAPRFHARRPHGVFGAEQPGRGSRARLRNPRLATEPMRAICAAFLGPRGQAWLVRAICTAFLGPNCLVGLMRAICTAFLGPRGLVSSCAPSARRFRGRSARCGSCVPSARRFWGRADTPDSRTRCARLCAALSPSRRVFFPFGVWTPVGYPRKLSCPSLGGGPSLPWDRRGHPAPLAGFSGSPHFPAHRPR